MISMNFQIVLYGYKIFKYVILYFQIIIYVRELEKQYAAKWIRERK